MYATGQLDDVKVSAEVQWNQPFKLLLNHLVVLARAITP
jgi:hypothetical protein